jgi:hypothetical protein
MFTVTDCTRNNISSELTHVAVASLVILVMSRNSKSKSHYDRQSVGQSVLVSGAHLRPATNFSSSLKFSSDSCVSCNFVAPSQTRGLVCNLLVQLLLGLVRAVTLGSKSGRTHGHILLSLWDSPYMEGQVPVLISLRNKVAQLYPRALGSLSVVSYLITNTI